jgi:hypothetical protein
MSNAWKQCQGEGCERTFRHEEGRKESEYCSLKCERKNTRKTRMGKAQRRGLKLERKIVDEWGGKTRPGSGNLRSLPGDGIKDGELLQVKTTTKDSIRITKAIWTQIEQEALLLDRTPKLILDISGLRLEVRRWEEN